MGWFSQRVAAQVVEWQQNEGVDRAGLTNHELDVLRFLVSGRTNHETAVSLGISIKTAEMT